MTKRSHHYIVRLLTIFLILSGGLLAGSVVIESPPTLLAEYPQNPALPVANSSETESSNWHLQIPTIKLNAPVQKVGLTSSGAMGVPSNYNDVGWLETGPEPGQVGTAVIAGHLNSGPNKPAAFTELASINPGDYIYISNKDINDKLHFKVTDIKSYDVNTAPLEKIFGNSDTPHLNLITCDGKWDNSKKDYTKRLVVFSKMI